MKVFLKTIYTIEFIEQNLDKTHVYIKELRSLIRQCLEELHQYDIANEPGSHFDIRRLELIKLCKMLLIKGELK